MKTREVGVAAARRSTASPGAEEPAPMPETEALPMASSAAEAAGVAPASNGSGRTAAAAPAPDGSQRADA